MATTNSVDRSITTHELLVQSAEAALGIQRDDGSFPPPQTNINEESPTPVRTTARWILTLAEAYEITTEDRFYDAVSDAVSYLLGDEPRPNGFTFHIRNACKKDKCDGLVGQSAPIRALARASTVLNQPGLADVAQDIVHLHPFNDCLGLWERVEIDGTALSFDRTLNHQLIFAASISSLVDDDPDIDRLIRRFLTKLPSTMRLHNDGLIRHYIRPDLMRTIQTVARNLDHWQLLLNEVVFHYYSHSPRRRRTEIGYHPINLSSLAVLRQAVPDHPIWRDKVIHHAVKFIQANPELYMSGTESYGGSTMPGTDVALALNILNGDDINDVMEFIESDIQRKYDKDTGLLTRTDSDSTFQAATVHLLSRFPNISIQL